MYRKIRSTLAILATLTLVVACGASTETSTQERDSSGSSTATSTPATEPVQLTPVLAQVVAPPIPVPTTDGKVHLAYELTLTNVVGQDVTVSSVAAKDGDQTLLSLAGDEVGYWMRVAGNPAPTTKLGPAQSAYVWLDVVIDKNTTVPQTLSHDVTIALSEPSPPLFPATLTEDVAPVSVSVQQPAVISPPLDGPRWLDGNSCCDMTAHRMALNPLNGSVWAAERFAIDYVQLSADGTVVSGDATKPESYPYFGADIHAVADGPVVAVLDGLPEQVAGKSPTGLPLDQYAGNHVVQDIGNGNYALYAHLETDSVQIEAGDQLTSGQVIANLGNTGNTDAPHLHFHVMNTPDPLKSNGVPFVFSTFTLDGRLASMDDLDPLIVGKPAVMEPGFTPRDAANVSPLVLDVMTYAQG